MENQGRPIQALLTGLGKLGIDAQPGDTVFFGRRKPPTVDELETRMEAIRREIRDHEASRKLK
jgi:hypothetical protein